jgi:UDP:flavonoid glycosyltransferase YjiC (YdhE family)
MKILFSTRPAYGHVYPLMPLAHAARAAGHEVAFATAGPFLAKVAALGFPTFAVGITFDEAFAEVAAATAGDGMPRGEDGRPDLDTGGRLFIDVLARRTATDLAPLLERLEPDVVVYEQGELGAAITAHVAGIPAVCHSISPRMSFEAIGIVSGDRLTRLWAEHGATHPSLDVFTGDVYLDIVPTVLQQRAFLADPARTPMRPVPFAEPGAVLPAWVARVGRPLVYLTLGTIVATDEVLRPAIEGLATLDADVLVALGSAAGGDLGPLPANVHVEAFVDQAALLRHVDLVVHHAGTGTILGALTNGTPQVLLPKGADQFQNSDAMAAAGLAPVLEPSQVTPEAVAALAHAELDRPRPAVAAVRREIAAMPEPADVLALLVDRFGTRRSAARSRAAG